MFVYVNLLDCFFSPHLKFPKGLTFRFLPTGHHLLLALDLRESEFVMQSWVADIMAPVMLKMKHGLRVKKRSKKHQRYVLFLVNLDIFSTHCGGSSGF